MSMSAVKMLMVTKISMFVLYLWITAPLTKKKKKKKKKQQHGLCFISKLSTFFQKIICASFSKLSKELKNGIKIEVGQAVCVLQIKPIF